MQKKEHFSSRIKTAATFVKRGFRVVSIPRDKNHPIIKARPKLPLAGRVQRPKCTLRVDRVVLTSGVDIRFPLSVLTGFSTVSDHALKNVNRPRFALPYGRVREMVNAHSRTKLFINYNPRFRQLPGLRVTAVPEDASGMQRNELEEIVSAFAPDEFPEGGLRVVEVAVDFIGGAMTAELVRRHAKFGKCRARPNVRFPHAVWYGVPSSDHFLRCYPKPAVGGFRVELQCNRQFLLKHQVRSAADIVRLPPLLIGLLRFCRMDWVRLSACVRRRPRYAEQILQKARERENYLNELLRFLRVVKIWNPERFLIPLPLNEEMERAVGRWATDW